LALSSGAKVKIARGLVGVYLTAQYYKEMQENYRKGDWLEAAKDTAFFSVAMAPVVAPNFFFGSVAFPVTVGIGTGLIATAVILEVTGIGEWEDVVEFALDPPTPAEWAEVVGPAIVSEVTDPAIKYLKEDLWQKQIVDPITGWGARRKAELIQAKQDLETGLEKYWALTSPF
jgi:hypothetical protein